MTTDNRTNEPKQTKAKSSQDFVFTEAQIEAAGVAFNTFERNYLDLTPLEKHHSRIRAALVAAARVPAQGEPNDVREALRKEFEYRIRTAVAYGSGLGYRELPVQERADWIQREIRNAVAIASRTTVPDAREHLHAKCDCVPDLGPAHCHLCGNAKDSPVPWTECEAVAVPDAATEAKRPEGWSTEDRQESKQEAERRWVDERSGYKSDYNRGCINGFILGAEWQKARETFISYKVIADEARAERDAATAAIERVRAIHQRLDTQSQYPMPPDWKHMKLKVCSHCKRQGAGDALHPWPCPTVAALDGAPEPEVKP